MGDAGISFNDVVKRDSSSINFGTTACSSRGEKSLSHTTTTTATASFASRTITLLHEEIFVTFFSNFFLFWLAVIVPRLHNQTNELTGGSQKVFAVRSGREGQCVVVGVGGWMESSRKSRVEEMCVCMFVCERETEEDMCST